VRFPERNEFIDNVLAVVLQFASQKRRIFFSSFDPDVAVMLHVKQSLYPVFFLTDVGKSRQRLDWRRTSLRAAVQFSRSTHLLGVISRVAPVLAAPANIKMVRDSGLVFGTYGQENNDLAHIRAQEALHVDIVVSDHITRARRSHHSHQEEQPKQN
jgi:glycerophosphodiester phosphodiesterase